MPIFEYCCCNCGNTFEELVMSSDAEIVCPRCGSSEVDKMFSPFASGSCGGCDSGGGPT